MESYQKELTQIRTILKSNPRGMTVTDIAREININRNSVAKYLDILLISGHAEMVTFGPAKVFFPSRRVPLSAVLNFTLDYVLLIDKDHRIIQINENLLEFLKTSRNDIIGKNIDTLLIPLFQITDFTTNVQKALDGSDTTTEIEFATNQQKFYLNMKYIPTTFDDGEPGVTLIIEDITERKNTEKKLRQVIYEWETTFNSVNEMISIHDAENTIIRANKSFADFFNLSPDQCIGKKCYTLLHGTNHVHQPCPCQQVQQLKKPITVEFFDEHLGKKLQISASPIINDQGIVTGSVHIMRELNR
ncbi:MAG: PAS domain-containing protein [Candidatus Thermoplasmatota archaeon]